MKQYWPMAVALDNDKPISLFTYDSCLSVDKCYDVFKHWQDDYGCVLLLTWIEVSEDEDRDIIHHECHVDAIGQVRKIC